ncbi:MAG: hypothetical protein OXC72_14210 [Roseovarius sp.]|nr:hypothetical protein [Roseovarius sp.]
MTSAIGRPDGDYRLFGWDGNLGIAHFPKISFFGELESRKASNLVDLSFSKGCLTDCFWSLSAHKSIIAKYAVIKNESV